MEEAIRALLETMPLATPPFEAYKPLIVDGLVYFIMRLPEERLQAIAAEQLGLGEASSNERIVALLRHCPTLHKLGQVVSHERALPIDFRRRLQFLETLPPAGDLGPVLERIRAEIGEIEGLEIGSAALAQGSVAIVVPFTLHKPHVKPKAGVFKVLLPGVEQRLAEDLAIWPELAGYLEERSNAYGLPRSTIAASSTASAGCCATRSGSIANSVNSSRPLRSTPAPRASSCRSSLRSRRPSSRRWSASTARRSRRPTSRPPSAGGSPSSS